MATLSSFEVCNFIEYFVLCIPSLQYRLGLDPLLCIGVGLYRGRSVDEIEVMSDNVLSALRHLYISVQITR